MSKAADLLQKLNERRENAEAVRIYWAELLPGIGAIPEPQLQSWLGRYDLDTIVKGIDIAVNKRSRLDAKGEKLTAQGAVSYASGAMIETCFDKAPAEERKLMMERRERLHEIRSAAARKRWDKPASATSDLPDVASASTVLHEVASPLHTGFGVGFASGSDFAVASASASGGEDVHVVASRRGEERQATPSTGKAKAEPKPKTNGTPNPARGNVTTGKTKNINTAKGMQPMPKTFDSWPAEERAKWIACTCNQVWGEDDYPYHYKGCAALPKKAKRPVAEAGGGA